MASRAWLWLAVGLMISGRSSAAEGAPSSWPVDREVVGLSIALSEETADAPVSLFGHLFVIIRTTDKQGAAWPLRMETAINVAVAADGPLDAAEFREVPAHRLLHEATAKEGRSVAVIDLALTKSELAALGAALGDRRGVPVRYDLLRRNCAFYVLDWLSHARPEMARETRWRPVWTPRQAVQLIESHFEITERQRLPAQSWERPAEHPPTARPEPLKPGWAATEEGVAVTPLAGLVHGRWHPGLRAELGHRTHATRPVGETSSHRLGILRVTHLDGQEGDCTDVQLLEFESLREFRGERPRLSQRLEIGHAELPRIHGLRGWMAEMETGVSTRPTQDVWISVMAGLTLAEGSPGIARPCLSTRLSWTGDRLSLQATHRTTGGDKQGWEIGAEARLQGGISLQTRWVNPETGADLWETGVGIRF